MAAADLLCVQSIMAAARINKKAAQWIRQLIQRAAFFLNIIWKGEEEPRYPV